jgi:two-component system sensor kinase FixL
MPEKEDEADWWSAPDTNNGERQAQSRERSALLQSVINTSPEAIVVIDDRGIVREFSPQGERMFGYAAREVVGRNVSMLMPQPYRDEHDGYLRRFFETGEKRIIGKIRELTARRKDGSTVPIELMVDEVFVNDMRLFTGFIRDVSLRKATEEELRSLNAELIHAGRVAAMGEMASAIAHEINQPLTAIANYVAACRRLLERPDVPVDTIRDISAKVDGQITRTREIVRHFRSFVRKDQPQRSTEDFNQLIRDALALGLVGAQERGVETEIRLTPSIPALVVDAVQIQQVVLNLVRNAIDALQDVPDRRLVIATSWEDGDDDAEFSVHDSGPGLAPEIREKLFKPFMTTKPQGMGIGLSLCRSIVAAHEGRLWAESNDWGGTTFRFTLPLNGG